MDAGVYAINSARFFVDGTVVDCTKAELTEAYPSIDSYAKATLTLALPGNEGKTVPAVIEAAISAPWPWFSMPSAKVVGTKATLIVKNFLIPGVYHSITVVDTHGKVLRSERHYAAGQSTYQFQLEAFAKAVTEFAPGMGGLVPTSYGGVDPIGTMKGIDAIYRRAGWAIRQSDTEGMESMRVKTDQ